MRIIMLLIGLGLSGCTSFAPMGQGPEVWIVEQNGSALSKIYHCKEHKDGPQCTQAELYQ